MSDEQKTVSADQAIQVMERAKQFHPSTDFRLSVRKFNPGGMTAQQTTDAVSIYSGIDWEARQIVIVPAKPLTELTPEQVDEISKSIRMGQSWHAYEREKKYFAREKDLKARLSKAIDLLKEMHELADNWPGIAYTADLGARYAAFLKEVSE